MGVISFDEAVAAVHKLATPERASLYVHRPLLNADRLHAWADRVGIKNLVPPHEMHVTQVYSRKPVTLEPRDDNVTVQGGDRRVAPLGDKGAVVLHFHSDELQARHREAMDAGASHDWPAYRTHVTLSYDNAGGADPRTIEGPSFPLQFGPEVHASINDNWAEEKGLRKYVAENFAKAFDPDEARDGDGRWTDGGAAFVSPSIEHDKDFQGAVDDLHGARQKLFERMSDDVDHAVGIETKQTPVVGAWVDGAENSTMAESKDATPEQLKVSAAMKGWLAKQRSVLVFSRDPNGAARLYDATVPGAPKEVHQGLLKAGIAFHTLIPTSQGTRVLVVDTDGSMGHAMDAWSDAHGIKGTYAHGSAEFIGDSEGTGSDPEQRARARQAYEQVIASSNAQFHGSSAGELWRGLRDRWSAPLESQKRALSFAEALSTIQKFNPDQPRDDHGRWSEAGGDFAAGIKAKGAVASKAVKQKWIEHSPLKTIQAVYAHAEENKRTLDSIGHEVARVTGTEYRAPGIKGAKRVLQKDEVVKMAAGRAPAGVTDIVRSTFVAKTPEEADHVAEELGKHFPITDEGWKTTEVGYFDRAVNVRFKNGQIGEVLIAPPELVEAKSPSGGGGHTIYQKWRELPPDHPEAHELAQKQIALYSAARAALSPSWSAAMASGR